MSKAPQTFEEAFDLVAVDALAEAVRYQYVAHMYGFDPCQEEHLLDALPVMAWLRVRLWPGRGLRSWLRACFWERHPKTDAMWARLAGLALSALSVVDGKRPEESLTALRDLMASKQRDYSAANILDFGQVGCVVRANDKVRRLENLLTRRQAPRHESVRGSWADLTNYALIARMVRRGWFTLPLAEAGENGEAERSAA
ncbi:MAG: hypothetical protein AB1609_12645 [Bacillota bacterium]